jgi:hypothetical protein
VLVVSLLPTLYDLHKTNSGNPRNQHTPPRYLVWTYPGEQKPRNLTCRLFFFPPKNTARQPSHIFVVYVQSGKKRKCPALFDAKAGIPQCVRWFKLDYLPVATSLNRPSQRGFVLLARQLFFGMPTRFFPLEYQIL